jgi:hypothetical protein
MTYSERVSQWSQTVSSHLPQLSRPQARVLALWSLGMLLLGSCGISQISTLLALLLDGKEASWRQRLREWLYDARDKKGSHRQQIEVQSCFGPLLSWMLELWQGEPQLALALDATKSSRGYRLWENSGANRWTALCKRRDGWPVPSSCFRRKATSTPGSSSPTCLLLKPRRRGIACAAGLKRASRMTNEGAGTGITARCARSGGWSGSGWQ